MKWRSAVHMLEEVDDAALELSEESPKTGLMLAQELFKCTRCLGVSQTWLLILLEQVAQAHKLLVAALAADHPAATAGAMETGMGHQDVDLQEEDSQVREDLHTQVDHQEELRGHHGEEAGHPEARQVGAPGVDRPGLQATRAFRTQTGVACHEDLQETRGDMMASPSTR